MIRSTPQISAGGYLRGDKALAEYLGVCLRTAINLRLGGFPHYRIGRGVFLRRVTLTATLKIIAGEERNDLATRKKRGRPATGGPKKHLRPGERSTLC